MFTGIIEHKGTVAALRDSPGGRRLSVDAGPLVEDARAGASIAVDGVCLTIAALSGRQIDFDVITETLNRSTLGALRIGSPVNLERAMRADGRVDGHFVQGHIDGTATVTHVQASPHEWVIRLRAAGDCGRFMVPKGSVTLAGVSLTIAMVDGDEFGVALIPTTLRDTTLVDLKAGDVVNVESDILARTVIHALEQLHTTGALTEAKLREHGFL